MPQFNRRTRLSTHSTVIERLSNGAAVHFVDYRKWLLNQLTWLKVIHSGQSGTRFNITQDIPDSEVHGVIMGPTWVLSAPDGPHVGPMNFATRDLIVKSRKASKARDRCLASSSRSDNQQASRQHCYQGARQISKPNNHCDTQYRRFEDLRDLTIQINPGSCFKGTSDPGDLVCDHCILATYHFIIKPLELLWCQLCRHLQQRKWSLWRPPVSAVTINWHCDLSRVSAMKVSTNHFHISNEHTSDAMITSISRQNDVATSFWRNQVIMTSLLRRVSAWRASWSISVLHPSQSSGNDRSISYRQVSNISRTLVGN